MKVWLISLLFPLLISAQKVSAVYKIDELLNRIDNARDTTYVINFWATWCKPCVKELPAFDSLNNSNTNSKLKFLLVSLDFKDKIESNVNPFLSKHKYKLECVLLDEVNGNDFIDKIDESWSGAIPATLIVKKSIGKRVFLEKKLNSKELMAEIEKFN
ncbi:MAG: TlpA disulfide reductase family protein [Bacteroidia bacterium]